ncbi:MAG: adenosine deaminase family protein [Bacteroidetes bacterium]|nr:adenosine deaminase family protein [Bacteroidota bacterium]
MSFKFDINYLKLLPKTELHVHLDGSLRLSTLIELAKSRKIKLPSNTESGLKELVFKSKYKNLVEYLHGFGLTCSVLQDEESLEQVAYELAIDNFEEGVRYCEVRFAPQLHVNDKIDIHGVVESVTRGFDKAKKEINSKIEILSGQEPRFEYGIIIIAMRMFTGGFSDYFKKFTTVHKYTSNENIYSLASFEMANAVVKLRDEGFPIVAFDLAGQESGYPAGDHFKAFDLIHKNFISKTVHAGEAYGPESIFQAITELHADRIGHGFHIFSPDRIQSSSIKDKESYIKKLAQYIAEHRITLEVCLTSNLQTMPELENNIKNHALKKMLEARLSISLCTDNRLVSNTTVTNEIKLAVDNFDISPKQLKDILIYGFKRSFYYGSYQEKREYVRSNINYYEQLSKKFGYQI